MFRAFWRWCATRDEYKAIVDTAVVEDTDVRAEVPAARVRNLMCCNVRIFQLGLPPCVA